MLQNRKRKGFGFGEGRHYATNEKNAEIRVEIKANNAMHADEIAAFYAAHPEFAKQR